MKIRIATAQFPIGPDIKQNKAHILQQMQEAANKGARVIQFPESSLTGYPGIDMESFGSFDWKELKACSEEIMQKSQELSVWVLLGSAHPLTPPHKPHNSIYILNPEGLIEDRYDKLFCASDDQPMSGELSHFSPGDHFTTFSIDGIKCSCLICHDYRYPELYRQLKLQGVQIVFHSFYAGNMDKERKSEMEAQVGNPYHKLNFGRTLPEITMPATMISYAANNYLWISCSNTSAEDSCWPSFVVRPDGVTVRKAGRNRKEVLITNIDLRTKFYDATHFWRSRSIEGTYHSGQQVKDKRSRDRNSL